VALVESSAKEHGICIDTGGKRNTCEDSSRLTPLADKSLIASTCDAGGRAFATLRHAGLDLNKEVTESGNADYYNDWLLEGIEGLSVRQALALKTLDTLGAFGYAGDTIHDVDPVLKKAPGFQELSLALDGYFQMEDALTSGYNDSCGMMQEYGDADRGSIGILGAGTNRRRGPGSLKSKALLKHERTTKMPKATLIPPTGSADSGSYPFNHLHPKFRDHEDIHSLCEFGCVQLRGYGDTAAKMPGACRFQTAEAPFGPPECKLTVPTGERWQHVLLTADTPQQTCCLSFQLLPDISATDDQKKANVELMMVQLKETMECHPRIAASKPLKPTDDLTLWVPKEMPMLGTDVGGISWQHPDCLQAKTSAAALSDMFDPGGRGGSDADVDPRTLEAMMSMFAKGKGSSGKGGFDPNMMTEMMNMLGKGKGKGYGDEPPCPQQ